MPRISKLKDPKFRAQFTEVYNDRNKYKTVPDVAREMAISERSVRMYADTIRSEGGDIIDRSHNGQFQPKDNKVLGIQSKREKELSTKLEKATFQLNETQKEIKELKKAPPLSFDDRVEVKKLKDSLSQFQKDLKEAEKNALTSESLLQMIWGSEEHDFGNVPNWLENKDDEDETHGIPCLFLSDIHFDEKVEASQIGFVNKFNREIAENRIQHTFNTSIDILFKKTVNPSYDGMVIALGGDMLSGNIHEELAETNEDAIQRSLLRLADLLIEGIQKHLEYFDNIFIPCVVGNHGRHHKKKRMKNKVFDNYEWLVYQFIARFFKDDKRVTVYIPEGPDANFKIYDKGFLLTHGDQFRGGNAIAGIFSPLMLGFHRKQKKQAAIGESFDVMMVGHFHQYVHTNNLIINGSIKGYDEFANECNFSFERPQQALFINHPKHGMIMRTPILCDSYEDKGETFENKAKIVVLK